MPFDPDFSDKKCLEKYSSAFSLSDMEIFVFPELLYPLVIANIMSPIIWQWRDDPWFKDILKKTSTYKVNRIKQYIMDKYVFNLDLETWGLTNKETELSRFKEFVDISVLEKSNALFGYEGDKYYYSIDIRRHFGLDKYTTDVIPYWKTETVEAMTAFRYKENFGNGAGECVSFSALYAAALFIVGRIPLEDIFMIGTPLHSQNFINIKEGMLTNNRRIVTKNMWFNGTAMSAKARRALENEKITIVAHLSGYIHYVYPKATINPSAFKNFSTLLKNFLSTDISSVNFINFLRYHMTFKKCFQYKHCVNNHDYYIGLETIFEYEHHSKYNFAEGSRDALLQEIEDEEFSLTPLENRITIQEVENYLNDSGEKNIDAIMQYFLEHAKANQCNTEDNLKLLFRDLKEFLVVNPQLPDADKEFIPSEEIEIRPENTREEIMAHVAQKAQVSETALLSLYAFRQMDKINWTPFLKAALERNPVSLEGLKGKTKEEVLNIIHSLPQTSVYDEKRLAQPDEVWNFGRGDGLEMAVLFANYLRNSLKEKLISLHVKEGKVTLRTDGGQYNFSTGKHLEKEIMF
ncbi:MAG TPA: hypothetical protein VHO90_07545 [Bacteroidales bacterium]|nr:hypothetical protein [Bacteroidales bacterium]